MSCGRKRNWGWHEGLATGNHPWRTQSLQGPQLNALIGQMSPVCLPLMCGFPLLTAVTLKSQKAQRPPKPLLRRKSPSRRGENSHRPCSTVRAYGDSEGSYPSNSFWELSLCWEEKFLPLTIRKLFMDQPTHQYFQSLWKQILFLARCEKKNHIYRKWWLRF